MNGAPYNSCALRLTESILANNIDNVKTRYKPEITTVAHNANLCWSLREVISKPLADFVLSSSTNNQGDTKIINTKAATGSSTKPDHAEAKANIIPPIAQPHCFVGLIE